jgi:hypothetical protein
MVIPRTSLGSAGEPNFPADGAGPIREITGVMLMTLRGGVSV